MTSIRKRLQQEKKRFQEELMDYQLGNINEETEDDIHYDDYDDDEWDDYIDWRLDDNDDPIDCYDGRYDEYDWWDDQDYEYPYKPGNHVEDVKTKEVFVVAEDYRLVNILTGKYKNFLYDCKVLM